MNDDSRRLAEEQASLRRVAMLVARATDPPAVFDLVTHEASRVLGIPILTLVRFEADDTATVMAAATDQPFPVGVTLRMDGPSVIAGIRRTGQSTRLKTYDGLRGEVASGLRAAGASSGYGVPIVVNGSLWGALAAVQTSESAPENAEERLLHFTELIATAIAAAQARDDLSRLAAEQASLRRVATLVARDTTGERFMSAVATEVQTLFEIPNVMIVRYDQRSVVVIGNTGTDSFFPLRSRWSLDGPSICATILDSGRPARMDDYGGLSGGLAQTMQNAEIASAAGSPITVNGHSWGAMVVSHSLPLPENLELRLAEYTELVATAITSADIHAELIASRARIVAASDEARRRVERDLHDGIQQRLIALALDVRTLRSRETGEGSLRHGGLQRLERDLESVLEEVREISRGLHPSLLARGGLQPALRALARRSPIAVELTVQTPRLPERVEVATYYVVSEALANAIKHSNASLITITVDGTDTNLVATVSDDGTGGAVVGGGTGLSGLSDRIDALGGTLAISSSTGTGTTVEIDLPLEAGD